MRTATGLLVLLAAATAAAADIPLIENPAEPAEGVRDLRLEPVWTVDTETAEELIGVIGAALSGPDGTVWLADGQVGQVLVYARTGELLRTVSREGDGPGEVRDPKDLLWLPDGGLGIVDRKFGQVTHVARDGTPRPSLMLTAADGEPMAAAMLADVQCRGGTLAASGTIFGQTDDGAPRQLRFFSVLAPDGRELRRVAESPSGFDFAAQTYDELAHWFVDRAGWAVDDRGLVHSVPDYDRYRIETRDARGGLVRVVERAYEPLARTDEEIAEAKSSSSMTINGERVELTSRVEKTWPAVRSLRCGPDGALWVRNSRANHDLSARDDGVVRVCDVFDADGRFREVVRVICDMDAGRDELVPLADGRWILLRNIRQAQLARYADFLDDEGRAALEALGAEPLRIVCLRAAAGGARR